MRVSMKKKELQVGDEEVDEDEVEDEEVWGPWLSAGPSGGLISGMCASLARSSSRSSSTSFSRSFSPSSLLEKGPCSSPAHGSLDHI